MRASLQTPDPKPVLGGSWVVTNGVITRVTTLISDIRGLITPLITTPETLNSNPTSNYP